eukprot:scaffold1267_cov171-Amphora_coffeaeformis.AAC.30
MKTVCVVGAGPAGLSAIKELKVAGLEPTCIDRNFSVGGRWSKSKKDGVGIWDELYLNLSRRWMEYSDFPWTEENVPKKYDDYAGLFAHHEEFRDYIEAYANHFDLKKHIQFGTGVVKTERDADTGIWTVVTQKVGSSETISHKFDALVVCTGEYCEPYLPLEESHLKEYKGELLHSAYFKSLKAYPEKKVLVVGSVISGTEIASGLADVGNCEKVSCVMRSVPYHLRKLSLQNKPFDDVMFIRLPAWLGRVLSDSAMFSGFRSTLIKNFPQLKKGGHCYADPDEDVTKAKTCASANLVEMVEQGKLSIVPGIEKVEGKNITFSDGTRDEFDVVICGTGYNMSIPFLPQDIQDKYVYIGANGKKQLELYHDTLVADMYNLAFAGVLTFVGPICPTVEMQSRLIAGVFSGKTKKPDEKRMKKVVAAERAARETEKIKQYKPCVVIMEEIGDDLGVTPSMFKAFWEPSKYLVGPNYAVQYRTNPAIDGEVVAKEAQQRFEYYVANPQVSVENK